MIYVVAMAPLMMHHAYTNFGGGGSGNMQQIQGPPQQLHLQQHQLQQWNNHIQKRSKYYFPNQAKISRNIKYSTAKSVLSVWSSHMSFWKEKSRILASGFPTTRCILQFIQLRYTFWEMRTVLAYCHCGFDNFSLSIVYI